MDRLGSEPILPVSVNLTVAVMETGMQTVCVNGPLRFISVNLNASLGVCNTNMYRSNKNNRQVNKPSESYLILIISFSL